MIIVNIKQIYTLKINDNNNNVINLAYNQNITVMPLPALAALLPSLIPALTSIGGTVAQGQTAKKQRERDAIFKKAYATSMLNNMQGMQGYLNKVYGVDDTGMQPQQQMAIGGKVKDLFGKAKDAWKDNKGKMVGLGTAIATGGTSLIPGLLAGAGYDNLQKAKNTPLPDTTTQLNTPNASEQLGKGMLGEVQDFRNKIAAEQATPFMETPGVKSAIQTAQEQMEDISNVADINAVRTGGTAESQIAAKTSMADRLNEMLRGLVGQSQQYKQGLLGLERAGLQDYLSTAGNLASSQMNLQGQMAQNQAMIDAINMPERRSWLGRALTGQTYKPNKY